MGPFQIYEAAALKLKSIWEKVDKEEPWFTVETLSKLPSMTNSDMIFIEIMSPDLAELVFSALQEEARLHRSSSRVRNEKLTRLADLILRKDAEVVQIKEF